MKRFYRAGIFPDRSFKYDVVWLDYPAADIEDARKKAGEFCAEHSFWWVFMIKELPKKKNEEPCKEPAEYGCDYDTRGGFDRLLDHFRMVGLSISCKDKARRVADRTRPCKRRALTSIFCDVNRVFDIDRFDYLVVRHLDHAVPVERADKKDFSKNGVKIHSAESFSEVVQIKTMWLQKLEVFSNIIRQFFHDRIVPNSWLLEVCQ